MLKTCIPAVISTFKCPGNSACVILTGAVWCHDRCCPHREEDPSGWSDNGLKPQSHHRNSLQAHNSCILLCAIVSVDVVSVIVDYRKMCTLAALSCDTARNWQIFKLFFLFIYWCICIYDMFYAFYTELLKCSLSRLLWVLPWIKKNQFNLGSAQLGFKNCGKIKN